MPGKTMEKETLKKSFETLLDIPNVTIEDVIVDRNGHFIVTVRSTKEETHCHKCGKRIDKFYGYAPVITLRHLPTFSKKVYIRIKPKRYQCPHCDGKPTTTQKLSWYEPRSSQTRVFEKRILLMCVNSTVFDVSIKEDMGYEAVMGVIDRHIEKEVDWKSIRHLDVLGLDEISLKKGHKDFVVIVTGRINNETQILGVLKDRLKATVKEFLFSIPKRLRRTVRAVCSDMYTGYLNAVKEVFGKTVCLVVDRFHIAKLYRDGLETLRKQELRRLNKELSATDYKELKGAMWALRKKDEDITEEERKILDKLFKHSPQLKQAYTFGNELTSIFDLDITRQRGKQKVNGWVKRVQDSNLKCFNKFITTLATYKDEISNYFVDRYTSGFVEGLNNKIKVIKRRCYGILNVEHLFQRISLDLSGYSLYA